MKFRQNVLQLKTHLSNLWKMPFQAARIILLIILKIGVRLGKHYRPV